MANILIKKINLFFYLGFFCLTMHVNSKDFGTYGQIFEVKEVNLLEYLQQKSQNLSLTEFNSLIENVKPQFKPVKNLTNAIKYRRFYFDPTVCAQEDILDHQKKVVIAKGTCVNPLDYTSLFTDLLFLDGSNNSHIEWAKTQSEQAYWILVKGDPLYLEQQEKRAIYFDQQGALSAKLNLAFLPAKVSQFKHLLLIEEFPLESLQ